MEDINKSLDQGNKEFPSGGGEWLRFQEGSNKMRILAFPAVLGNHYSPSGYKGVCIGKEEGCLGCKEETKPSAKWLTYIHDFKTKEIMLAKLGYKVMQQLGALQHGEEYGFEAFPMPYTIDINVKDAGTKGAEYTVMPSRENTELDPEIVKALTDKKSPADIIEAMKEKEVKKLSGDAPVVPVKADYPYGGGINPDDIPF